MSDNDKNREDLIAENIGLRTDIETLRRQQKECSGSSSAHNNLRMSIVDEIPGYVYGTEFTKGDLTAFFHSSQCVNITGYTPEDYAANPRLWIEMIHEDDRAGVLEFIRGLREPFSRRSIEHRIIRKDGAVRWVLNMSNVLKDFGDDTFHQSGFLIDVTERKIEDEQKMKDLDETRKYSLTDDLTQVYNRRAFRMLARQQIASAERAKYAAMLFYIDVDGLKYVNDTFGHGAGDALLADLAQILKSTFRESDIIARIGGDEFVVLSMESGPDLSAHLIERLQTNISDKNIQRNPDCPISASIGVSRHDHARGDDYVQEMLETADKDMYAQKRSKAMDRGQRAISENDA